MRFDAFTQGQRFTSPPYEVTEAAILQFARAFDPQWFHTEPDEAARGHFGGLIASGWHTCSIAMRLAVDTVLHDADSLASPGLQYVKWPHPVRPGDTLVWQADVLEARHSRSDPTLGILRWRWQLFNQHGTQVLDLEATSLFKPRAAH